jgi:hypothetical protein
MAASWSWGVSVLVGAGILWSHGVAAFGIWCVANVLALPLFGAVAARLPAFKRLLWTRPVIAAMLAIQLLAYWMNMQGLYEASTGGIDFETHALVRPSLAMPVVIVLTIVLAVFIYRRGFAGSVATDLGQYALQIAGCLAIIALALVSTVERPAVATSGVGDVRWALWGGLGLLSGPFLDAQQWQRFDAGSARAALWGGLWFGVYLALVAVVAVYLGAATPLLSVLLLVVVLAVATSTIDSASAAFQYLLGNRRRALVVGVGAALAWPIVVDVGIVSLWTYYASARAVVVGCLLLVAVAIQRGVLPALGRRPTATDGGRE